MRTKRNENDRFAKEKEEISAFLFEEEKRIQDLLLYRELTKKALSPQAEEAVRYFREQRYLGKRGALAFLRETLKEYLKEKIREEPKHPYRELEERYERYFEVLNKEDYL